MISYMNSFIGIQQLFLYILYSTEIYDSIH